MSVYASAYVWEHSTRKGTDLLLLLAIADIAHRNGVAFPSVKTLARYIRMSERNTTRTLQRLATSGELKIKRNAGPKGTHLFQIVMNQTLPLFSDVGDDKLSGVNLSGDGKVRQGVTPKVESGDTAASPEPSITKNLTEDQTFVGQKPPDPMNGRKKEFQKQAVEVIELLNTKAGKNYQPVKANVDLIVSLLAQGVALNDVRAVVAKKCREWRGKPDMELYLRPATLFGPKNFFQKYQGEIPKTDLQPT